MRARRTAINELRAAGFIDSSVVPGVHPVVPGSGASRPFARLTRGIDHGFQEQRDEELFVVLAWTGVLASRLSRSERRRAWDRLKKMIAPPPAQASDSDVPPIAFAVGDVAYRQEASVLHDLVHDLLTGHSFDVDSLGAQLGSTHGYGHGDAGGGHHGGGHHG